ncbi:MAG: CCA tRNA nucleotidyltransferase [Candidatus Viridilinea halotolerans]|uniref:CCA tRNA nucleotidyltransferase n=1 Tax=Candidatus Viridilinea halotolerans TaxID=2491704 RepID=A0A426U581_9CHLR|nr:MAG: CCA tRNA nucleotidyltransferase [Candidatus Viridilinea halotolerans]
MFTLPPMLDQLSAFAAVQGIQLWLVGGTVRDLLRGEAPVDIDLAVAGDGFALARAYADACGAAFVPLDASRATGRIVTRDDPPLTLDLAGLRGPDIMADLRGRDFTINALALPLGAQAAPLLDPTGGQADLAAGLLRPCSPTSLHDDPLRVLRAARFCARLGLRPVAALDQMMRDAAPGLAKIAPERCRDELLRLLDAPAAAPWLRYLDNCGALTTLLPELEPARACSQPRVHFLPVLAHSLETVAALDWLIAQIRGEQIALAAGGVETRPVAVQQHPALQATIPYAPLFAKLLNEKRAGGQRRSALLKFTALLHDNAKPQTKVQHADGSVTFYGHQSMGAEVALQIGRRLRLSRLDCAYVALVVREHMRPGQLRAADVVTPRATVRFFRELGDAAADVLLHELADHLAARGPQIKPEAWAAHLAWVEHLISAATSPPAERRTPLVNGHDLMHTLNLAPGPQLGALLRELAEAQAAGEITSRAEALALARERLKMQEA